MFDSFVFPLFWRINKCMQTVERREIFLLFKICQARGLRLRLRVQSQGLRQLHLPFRLARYRDSLQMYFPQRVIHHLWRLMLRFKDHMRMVLYQIFLVIQLQQVFQPGVLKEQLSPSDNPHPLPALPPPAPHGVYIDRCIKCEKRFKQKH